jgi:hypothetical protein
MTELLGWLEGAPICIVPTVWGLQRAICRKAPNNMPFPMERGIRIIIITGVLFEYRYSCQLMLSRYGNLKLFGGHAPQTKKTPTAKFINGNLVPVKVQVTSYMFLLVVCSNIGLATYLHPKHQSKVQSTLAVLDLSNSQYRDSWS